MNWLLDVDPKPALLVLPPAAASLDEAHAAIELWEYYTGKTLDLTQRLVVEVMMAETADGMWAAQTTGREMPRQNGKGDEIEVVELWGLVQRAESILHTIHDAVRLATQTHQRMLAVLEKPDLRRKKLREWKGVGQQMIEMRNGGVIFYATRTGSGGRGLDDISRLVVDEAQHAAEDQLASVTSTLMANPNPQLNAMGTSGLKGKSDWWWRMRKRALAADPGPFGYVGHTAENVSLDEDGMVVQERVDLSDRRLWVISNPVLKRDPSKMAFLEEEFQRLGPESFGQEHMGVWAPPPADEASRPFPVAWWSRAGEGENAGASHASPPVLVVDVAQDRSSSAIVAVGASTVMAEVEDDAGEVRSVPKFHVEVQEHRAGTDWLVPVLKASAFVKRRGVTVDGSAQAASLVGELEAAGIKVRVAKLPDVRKACGQAYDALRDDRVTHRNDPRMNGAVSNAVKVTSGDAWTIRRRDSDEDLTTLFGFVLGVWAFEQPTKRKPTYAY